MKLITSVRHDRIGMQINSIIYAIRYCQINNYEYIHTPLAEPYESHFNVGDCFRKYNTIINKNIIENIGPMHGLTKLCSQDKIFFDLSNNFRNKLIQDFNITPVVNSPTFINSKGLKICIHCRRDDTEKLQCRAQILRYTPDTFINNVLSKLSSYFLEKSVSIHIYSDSKKDLLRNIIPCKFKIHYHINENIITSLNDMICCDILFRYGLSSFSGICAIYNKNIVISHIPDKVYEYLYTHEKVYKFEDCDTILQQIKISYS